MAGNLLAVLLPAGVLPPLMGYATLGIVADEDFKGRMVVDFDDSVSESTGFEVLVPYAGRHGVVVSFDFLVTRPVSAHEVARRADAGVRAPAVRWAVSLDCERCVSKTRAVTVMARERLTRGLMLLTGRAARCLRSRPFIVRLERQATHVDDTLVGDARVLSVELREYVGALRV